MHASYIKDKKSITHLAKDAKTGISSVRRALKSVQIIEPAKSEWIKEILLMIDTTYWGRNFGVTFFKDAISKKFIWWHFINRKEKKQRL